MLTALRPAALWLFAPDGNVKPHGGIIRAVKALDPAPRIFVQVGNVAAAREAVLDGADVVVCQGIDAGGHQFRKGMGVVSFVPEVRSLLEEEFSEREVGVLGAGGIADERGVAAAMMLGRFSFFVVLYLTFVVIFGGLRSSGVRLLLGFGDSFADLIL